MQNNPYPTSELKIEEQTFKYYNLVELFGEKVQRLPYSIRILLEQAVRNCDGFNVKKEDVERILNWEDTSKKDTEVAFKPARVILQDFTGVPLVVDLAAMRSQAQAMGKDPQLINPLCPVDLVIDHSVQVDFHGNNNAREQNEQTEFERNLERFRFLKWGSSAFKNFEIVPPGSGIVHQVNLEYLARVVFEKDNLLYPDSVVGTDSHTTMINGLGVLGWGVGGIEAEANMLGECTSMVLPQVVGFKLTGQLSPHISATDLVLTCTEMLRKKKVVGKFVEFYGPGVSTLSLADRATVSNMAPEYGATMGFFPVDSKTIDYLKQTGRSVEKCNLIKQYLKAANLFYEEGQTIFSDTLELDLSTIQACVAGPKRPQDRVTLNQLKQEFSQGLTAPVSFKGFNVKASQDVEFEYQGQKYNLNHGSVVIAAITSCTNTSNPGVMLAAGLVAKKAVQVGLSIRPYIKTSLSPGSQCVTQYYKAAGLDVFLDQLGFHNTGYGCMTCIGNSGPIDQGVSETVQNNDLVVAAVLSGNRNFEGRVHPITRANYLASPPLVVAFALAGRMDIDFENEAIGIVNGQNIFLKDIWPSREEIKQLEDQVVQPQMFIDTYQQIKQGTKNWNELQVPKDQLYQWDEQSTYIHHPPYFQGLSLELPIINPVNNAYCLAVFGDSITTDHISPAGNISANSPAGRYLKERGVHQKDFNTYGARRGNDEIMVRGTFANVRIKNKMLQGKECPNTIYVPTNEVMAIYDAAEKYLNSNQQTIIIGGAEYGSGSSRDWAAKGPYLQGVKAVIAISYERIHRSNLAGMGVLPLEFTNGQTAESLGLTGHELFTLNVNKDNIKVNQIVEVVVKKSDDTIFNFNTLLRLDTDVEIEYYKHGGILQYVLRKILK
ncbi:unnamed protein product [Paramecium sonneborni]|uniref:Aconitate hydratase n=1 Tax=Paramecium sonneborni TaxID=65129 RepID=A0A8S1M8P0_9CILI|nr:unnamed protein product [Paramecium sonneborni]